MKQHPLTMAVQHRPLETAMEKFAAIEYPSPIQAQAHTAELVAKALDGSEVLVLCSGSDDNGWKPVIAQNRDGESFAMAATSIGRSLDLDRWALSAGYDIGAEGFCYIPLSARELLLSQLAQGSDGILFNQTVLQPDTAGLIEFGSVALAIIQQFSQLLDEGTVMPEEMLTLLAMEDNPAECQQIARDYFLNPMNNFSNIKVFELQNVVVDNRVHQMTDVDSGRSTAHMFSTNATSVFWGFKHAMNHLPSSAKTVNVGFSIIMHNLPDLIRAMAVSGQPELNFLLDEKILIDMSFAKEIMGAHVDI